jgi:hypothetical protein
MNNCTACSVWLPSINRGCGRCGPTYCRTGGHPAPPWHQDVASTVIGMAAEMVPDEVTKPVVAHCMELQEPQVWRALRKGREDFLFLLAAGLQMRQTKRVEKHDGLHKRTPRARRGTSCVHARLRLRAKGEGVAPRQHHSGVYWTREQRADATGTARANRTRPRPGFCCGVCALGDTVKEPCVMK